MASFVLDDYARQALSDALNTAANNGVLELLEGVTLLVSFTLPDAANNTSANGVLTFDSIANANGVANGNANVCKFYNNGKANTIATGDVGTSGNTVVLDNINIAVNQVCSITSANITVPAGT